MVAFDLVSADDHMDLAYLPPTLWQERLPKELRDKAPKVTATSTGNVWEREGGVWGIYGSKRADGRKVVFDLAGLPEEPEAGVFRPSNPTYRLKDMDLDNIAAQVIYGPVTFDFTDQRLKAHCLQAYNSWLAEDFCSANPERLVGLALLPAFDPAGTVEELRRVAKLGLRSAIFDVFGATVPIFHEDWDPLWSTAEETGTVLSVHVGGGFHTLKRDSKVAGTWRQAAGPAVVGMQLDEILVSILMSGMLIRHPRLKLVLGESGIGWIPFVLERVDWERKNYEALVPALRSQPAAAVLFRDHVFATFQDEHLGIQLIPQIGADNVLWASDYPHGDGTFPRSREAVAHMFRDVDAAVRRKAVGENARRLYGLKPTGQT